MPGLESLDKLPVEIIQDFRRTKKSAAIPQPIQQYILQLDRAIEIYNYEGNISRAARQLSSDFHGNISFATARSRIYDAIHYFHLNNTVKNEAWNMYYADKMEDLAKLAIQQKNLTEARRCFEKAKSYRTDKQDKTIDPRDIKIKDQVISPDVSAERLGLEKFNLVEIWDETEEIIDNFDIESEHKKRIKKEAAQVIDIEHEEID